MKKINEYLADAIIGDDLLYKMKPKQGFEAHENFRLITKAFHQGMECISFAKKTRRLIYYMKDRLIRYKINYKKEGYDFYLGYIEALERVINELEQAFSYIYYEEKEEES